MPIWTNNVGTPENPVSYLHEYAVALIWDRLNAGGCFVKTTSGEYEHVSVPKSGRIAIPDELTPIAGMAPDIAIYDGEHRPVTIVEVQVTTPPSAEKMARVKRLGLKMVVVPVPNREALLTMFRPVSIKELFPSIGIPSRFYGHTNLVEKQLNDLPYSASNYDRKLRTRLELAKANDTVSNLIRYLKMCDPTLRQELRAVLDELDSIESQHPLLPGTPKIPVLRQEDKPADMPSS